MITIKSPLGPPSVPCPPFPFSRSRVPSSTPAGIRIFTAFDFPEPVPDVTEVSIPVIASSKLSRSWLHDWVRVGAEATLIG